VRELQLRKIGPAFHGPATGVADFLADRVRRLRAADDRGAMFFRYGVPLLVAAMLAVAFTDIEDDVGTAVQAVVDSVRSTVSSSVQEG
jgi:hypothetical protein